MAKRKYRFDEKKRSRWLKQGRGAGERASYKPWLTIHDLSSRGTSTRCWSPKTGRLHHLFSRLETAALLELEFDPAVTDIREQYPLDREITRAICAQMQVRHPSDRGVDIVMTSDFLIDRKTEHGSSHLIWCIKPAAHLSNQRVLEKLEIERRYWAMQGVPWRIVTEKQLPRSRYQNLTWARAMWDLGGQRDKPPGYWEVRCDILLQRLVSSVARTIKLFIRELELHDGFAPGEAITVIRHLVARRRLFIDMDRRFSLEDPLRALRVPSKEECVP